MRKLQKEKAISILKDMRIYKPYIAGFAMRDDVCFFENYGGFWAFQDEGLIAKTKEVEEEYGCLVYAVTHEYLEFGECYSLLIVTKYQEEWETLAEFQGDKARCFAYIWNKTCNEYSEFGDVVVRSWGGGIKRVC